MPTPKRRLDTGVIARMVEQPYRYEFFQAVRVLEHLFVGQGDRPGDVVGKRLQFHNTLTLGFPASELERMEVLAKTPEQGLERVEQWQAHFQGHLDSVALTPAFFGLLGGQGALPLSYTERLGEREVVHRDRAARAFLDIFSNRATALFYGAWKKYRLALQYELDRQGRFLPLTQALTGLTQRSLSNDPESGGVSDQALAFYSGAIGHRPLSAAYLQRVLSEYFQVPVRIEQFVGGWHSVPTDQRSHLGAPGLTLGRNALVGGRVWQRDLRMRLWVGPLLRETFDDFLPGANAAKALATWLTLMVGSCLEYEVCLVLQADQVEGVTLSPTGSRRLGRDAFLVTQVQHMDRTDARYQIATLH
ncbi:type VI secretion system baseplate subunit TssG [Pseudomonas sp. 18175]|uniref:type VI secretion system baseplate subunit TssG n=1 Tax=Pseudomonas sp. 18175 TaxID=3390056 RepID=UPI003D1CF779